MQNTRSICLYFKTLNLSVSVQWIQYFLLQKQMFFHLFALERIWSLMDPGSLLNQPVVWSWQGTCPSKLQVPHWNWVVIIPYLLVWQSYLICVGCLVQCSALSGLSINSHYDHDWLWFFLVGPMRMHLSDLWLQGLELIKGLNALLGHLLQILLPWTTLLMTEWGRNPKACPFQIDLGLHWWGILAWGLRGLTQLSLELNCSLDASNLPSFLPSFFCSFIPLFVHWFVPSFFASFLPSLGVRLTSWSGFLPHLLSWVFPLKFFLYVYSPLKICFSEDWTSTAKATKVKEVNTSSDILGIKNHICSKLYRSCPLDIRLLASIFHTKEFQYIFYPVFLIKTALYLLISDVLCWTASQSSVFLQ